MSQNNNQSIAGIIESQLMALADKEQEFHLLRFFQTGPGQYGEGDRFLGIRVPQTREIIKPFKTWATVEDIVALTASPFHEIRLAGFLLLVSRYSQVTSRRNYDPTTARKWVELYHTLIPRGNNWDLVDLVAPKILGHFIVKNPDEATILFDYAQRPDLWYNRVAIVSTWSIIRSGRYDLTLAISDLLLSHPHHLIHKAVGWMLREVGKRQPNILRKYLETNISRLPRTALRYAIERLDKEERNYFLSLSSS